MLEEQIVIDKIEILEDGQVQVRKATRILRDGVEIAKTYHRHVLEPGADVTKEAPRVAAHAKTAWTKDTLDEWKKKKSPK